MRRFICQNERSCPPHRYHPNKSGDNDEGGMDYPHKAGNDERTGKEFKREGTKLRRFF